MSLGTIVIDFRYLELNIHDFEIILQFKGILEFIENFSPLRMQVIYSSEGISGTLGGFCDSKP